MGPFKSTYAVDFTFLTTRLARKCALLNLLVRSYLCYSVLSTRRDLNCDAELRCSAHLDVSYAVIICSSSDIDNGLQVSGSTCDGNEVEKTTDASTRKPKRKNGRVRRVRIKSVLTRTNN